MYLMGWRVNIPDRLEGECTWWVGGLNIRNGLEGERTWQVGGLNVPDGLEGWTYLMGWRRKQTGWRETWRVPRQGALRALLDSASRWAWKAALRINQLQHGNRTQSIHMHYYSMRIIWAEQFTFFPHLHNNAAPLCELCSAFFRLPEIDKAVVCSECDSTRSLWFLWTNATTEGTNSNLHKTRRERIESHTCTINSANVTTRVFGVQASGVQPGGPEDIK